MTDWVSKRISRKEFVLLKTLKNYVHGKEDQLASSVKEQSKSNKEQIFIERQENASMVKDVEKCVFDFCYQNYNDSLDIADVAKLTEVLMTLRRYNR